MKQKLGIFIIILAMAIFAAVQVPWITAMVGGYENLVTPALVLIALTIIWAGPTLFGGPTYQSKGKSPWRGIRRKNK